MGEWDAWESGKNGVQLQVSFFFSFAFLNFPSLYLEIVLLSRMANRTLRGNESF
jgi:hypothetical protein